MKSLTLLGSALWLAVSSATASVTLVNAGFETSNLSGWTKDNGTLGGSSGSTTNANITAFEGSRYLQFFGNVDPAGPSDILPAVYQDFTTVLGQEYQLSFYGQSPNTNKPFLDVELFDVSSGTVSLAAQTFNLPAASVSTGPTSTSEWELFTLNFTATSTSSRLLFRDGVSSIGRAPLVDSVSITAVPEPSRVALLFLGGVAFLRRRRR